MPVEHDPDSGETHGDGPDPKQPVASVEARDVVIRRVRPSDHESLRRFYEGLPAESRRARFLGYQSGVSDELAVSFCAPDHVHAEGFVAVVSDHDGSPERIAGHLCLEPASHDSIELAVAVADDQRGRGIGRALFESAIAWAQQHRLQAIVASAFADNSRVLRLLTSSPYPARIAPADGGIVDVTVPLVPDLPRDFALVPSAMLRRRLSRQRAAASRAAPTRGCHVVWRSKPRPAGHVEGSASTGSTRRSS